MNGKRVLVQRGTASLEFVGMVPLLTLAALFAWQLLLFAFTVTAAENAARAGSRAASRGDEAVETALGALPTWLQEDARAQADGTRVTVTIEVPLVMPNVSTDLVTMSRSAELPEE